MSFPGVGISGPRSLLGVSISGPRSLLGGCRYLEGVGRYTGYTQECRYNKGGRYTQGVGIQGVGILDTYCPVLTSSGGHLNNIPEISK